MASARRSGQRNPAVDTAPGISVIQLLRDMPAFIRRDFSGRNQNAVISQRLTADGIPVTPETIKAYQCGAIRTRDTIKEYLKPRFKQLRSTIGF